MRIGTARSLLAASAVAVAALLPAGPAGAQEPASRQGYGTDGYAPPGQGLPAYGASPPSAAQPYWAAGHGWIYPRYAYVVQPGYLPPGPGGPDQASSGAADSKSGVAFDMAVGTAFPLGMGPQLGVELPGRLLLSLELGWMPAAYGSAVVGIIETFGKENNILGRVVEDSLADSFVFRASGGWRPFPSAGFEIWLGYTTIVVSGAAPPDVVAGVIGGELHDRIEAELTDDLVVDAQLHNIHVALGWRFLAADDHLVIRAAVGYTQTLGSSSSVEIPQSSELQAEVDPVFSDDLDTILRHDVKLPVMSATVGYRF